MTDGPARPITAVLDTHKDFVDLRMRYRLAGFIGNQVLLRDVCDVSALGVFGEKVVEWLVLLGAYVFGDR